MFNEYTEFVKKNKDCLPAYELIPLEQKQNRFQYVGGQIENGKLYGIVNSAEKMLRYDMAKDTMDFPGRFDATDFKWTGGCVFEHVLFSFPRSANSLLRGYL